MTIPDEYPEVDGLVTPHQLNAATISLDALQAVADRYGVGDWNLAHEPGTPQMTFHNVRHSSDVYLRAGRMADALGLPDNARADAGLAGAAHAVRREGTPREMREASAAWLLEKMHGMIFWPPQMEAVGLAILGTEPVVGERGVILGQRVGEQEYPSKGAEAIAQAVACADMGWLYQADGPFGSHLQYLERFGYMSDAFTNLVRLHAYQEEVIALTDGFRFSHPKGEEIFGAGRAKIVDYHTRVLGQIESGQIANWHDIEHSDQAFMNANRSE